MLLFLGAGASKQAADLPLMKELTKEILETSSQRVELNNLRTLFDESADIETLGAFIAECHDPISSINSFTGHDQKYLKELGKKIDLNVLTNEVIDILDKKTYQQFNKIFEFYTKLFNFISTEAERYSCQVRKFNLNGKEVKIPENFVIVTTNYDLTLEIFFDRLASENIYFSSNWGNNRNKLDVKSYDKEFIFGTQLLKVYKLHGSVNYKLNDHDSITVCDKKIGEYELSEKIMSNCLIFPMREKYISRYPYFDLLYYFKKELTRNTPLPLKWVFFVGYSFRDEAINNILTSVFRENKNLQFYELYNNNQYLNKILGDTPRITSKKLSDAFK